ncbi:hypothetical protein KSP40_PGU008156 [Platanthera guangdongensis]|uniref:Uncharacterized protein n=1 Tax=Platanthera guangdongensis TaxID=2320717 RepID=A0ABR2MJF0_9ASPA
MGAPTLPTLPQESAAVASTRQESTPPHAKYEALKMKEKMAARDEDEGARISAGYGYKQDSVVDAGRKYSGVASVVLNKRKIILLSVILGVLISLGLAVYLSYRLKDSNWARDFAGSLSWKGSQMGACFMCTVIFAATNYTWLMVDAASINSLSLTRVTRGPRAGPSKGHTRARVRAKFWRNTAAFRELPLALFSALTLTWPPRKKEEDAGELHNPS